MLRASLRSSASDAVTIPPSTPLLLTEKRKTLSQAILHQRFESRRVKKQNMERVRRARISDRILQLHGLALSIAGKDAESDARTEKVEMLGFCHQVLSNLHELMEAHPEVKERLKLFQRKDTVKSVYPQKPEPVLLTATQTGEASFSYTSWPIHTSQSSAENSATHAGCRLPPKKRQEVWRPYL